MSFENLEPVLKKHLGRVPAPANLWSHVQGPKRPTVTNRAWVAAVATVAIVAGVLWNRSPKTSPFSVEAMALAALDRPAEELTLRTEDAASIRKWVRTGSGIDIPLPPKHSSVIRIQGASVLGETQRFAEVSYQVGEFRAALLVAKDPTGARSYPKHDFRGSDPLEAARVTSWSMKGQSYTLAWTAPGEFRTACLLCHDQEPPMIPSVVN